MSIATSTLSPSSTAFTPDEARAYALDVIADARALPTYVLDRTARKVLNQALFVVGMPTLGSAHTWAQYARRNRCC